MVRRASSTGLGEVLRSRFRGPAAPRAGSDPGFRGIHKQLCADMLIQRSNHQANFGLEKQRLECVNSISLIFPVL